MVDIYQYYTIYTHQCRPNLIHSHTYTHTHTHIHTHTLVVVSLSLGVVSRADKTFKLTCFSYGGILTSGALVGPGLPGSGLQLEPDRETEGTGENQYSVTTSVLSEDAGSLYTCTGINEVSTEFETIEVTGTYA